MAETVAHASHAVLERLGINDVNSGAGWGEWIGKPSGGELASINPNDGSTLALVRMASEDDYEVVMRHAVEAFESWRMLPAPKRGLIVREIGDELRRASGRPRRAGFARDGQDPG